MMGRDTSKFARRNSLCWACSKATDSMCDWSEKLKPVDGWTANWDEKKQTWFVIDCPEFDIYENNTITDKGAKLLGNAVIASAGKDYLYACRASVKHSKRISWAKTVINLYGKHICHIYGRPYNTKRNYESGLSTAISLERFFRSEHALLFSEDVNPVWLMEAIQRETGYDKL